MGVPVLGWREPAGTPTGRAAAGTDAGRLRRTPRRYPPTAGLSAHPGRESGRLGSAVAGSVSPWVAGQEPAVDRDRRLSRLSGRDPDDLSSGAAPALLGTQDAQYPGEGTEVRL